MGKPFATLREGDAPVVTAPDGSEVTILPSLAGGSMARFRLRPTAVARAIVHRTVEEIWVITAGSGQMWRKLGDIEELTGLAPGISLTIPAGCRFQFRCDGDVPLEAVAVTMPPWPGEDEAVFVEGPWTATVETGRPA